uniref:Rhomboid protease n=1 Tax=Ascaris lumbricoides TaxID=6252 RepID=A0A0M3IL34_ASCLU
MRKWLLGDSEFWIAPPTHHHEMIDMVMCASAGVFDTNHDGYIGTNDLRRFVRQSAYSFGLTTAEADALLTNVDKNNDHLVDYPEFCTLMSKAKKMHMHSVMFRAAQLVVPRNNRTAPFSYLQQYNCFPPPLFMILLTVTQVCSLIFESGNRKGWNSSRFVSLRSGPLFQIAVYAYYVIEMKSGIQLNGPVPIKSPLIFNPYKIYEVWRYLTYMFIHIGFYHLIFNVLTQILLGVPLELVHKQWRIALVYLSGVLAGSLLVAVVDPRTYLAGASGGVYALLAAHIAELLLNWSEMEFALLRTIVLAILISSDAAVAVYQRYYAGMINKISYVSHIGGFVAGVLMGIIVLRNFRKKRWERVTWWTAIVILTLLLAATIVLNIAPRIL